MPIHNSHSILRFAAEVLGLLLPAGCTTDEGSAINGDDRCAECHTSPKQIPAPIFEKYGLAEKGKMGAHRFHLNPRYASPVSCFACHPEVPSVWETPTHINKKVDVILNGFDPQRKSCEVYCHGTREMTWQVEYEDPTFGCTECHNRTDPPHDITEPKECHKCHDKTVTEDGKIKSGGSHINAEIDVVDNKCTACHEYPPSNHNNIVDNCSSCHPPTPTSPFRSSVLDSHRNEEISFKEDVCSSCHDYPSSGGAHAAHLDPRLVAGPIECNTCHSREPSLPLQPDIFEHLNPDTWPPVVFGGLAISPFSENVPSYDIVAKQCSNVYCHGGGLPEGQILEGLNWNDDSGEAKRCGGCHGIPPSDGGFHEPSVDMNCSACHPQLPAMHINGEVDVQ